MAVQMKRKTRNLMVAHAKNLPPGRLRAQCYTIANYRLNNYEAIAARILRAHSTTSHALRAMQLMSDAGAAKEEKNPNPNLYGTFIFEDGSRYNQ